MPVVVSFDLHLALIFAFFLLIVCFLTSDDYKNCHKFILVQVYQSQCKQFLNASFWSWKLSFSELENNFSTTPDSVRHLAISITVLLLNLKYIISLTLLQSDGGTLWKQYASERVSRYKPITRLSYLRLAYIKWWQIDMLIKCDSYSY